MRYASGGLPEGLPGIAAAGVALAAALTAARR